MSCPTSKAAVLLLLFPLLAGAASEEELFFKNVSEVNDGELRFLAKAPDKPVHHHQNRLFIGDDSMATGWVRLEQCHEHLDPVPSMQIVYGKDRVRNLVIRQTRNIGKAWVHEHTVQMEQVERNALICVSAETHALRADGEGVYSLSNGPFMRRFLDGYYPMRVSLDVSLETDRLHFIDITPGPQTGFAFQRDGKHFGYEALFEGRLNTVLRFGESR